MGFWELAAQPLFYEQKAPLGYLWLVHLSVVLFGRSEIALRLVSLICGLASLLLFLTVARHFLKSTGVVLAVAIMALAPPLVYHTVEAKLYVMELLASVLCLLLYIRYGRSLAWKPLLSWSVWGAIMVWLSYSSIFILAGIAASVGLAYLINKNGKTLIRVTIPFTLWFVSFTINYALFTYKSAAAPWLTVWFAKRDSFVPSSPISAAGAKWVFQRVYNLLDYPLGLLWKFAPDASTLQPIIKLSFVLLALGLCGLSIVKLLRKDYRSLLVLTFPLFLVLIASGLKIHPFYERLTVFLAPLLIILLALGSEIVLIFSEYVLYFK